MIREYLLRLQALQLATLGSNVSMEIQIRQKANGDVWLVAGVNPEVQKDEDWIYHSEHFAYYDFQTPDENFKRLENKYNTIEEFINKYKK